MKKSPFIAAALLGALLAAQAQQPVQVKIYAQELVDRIAAQHPDLRAVVMHVTPPKTASNIVIASSIGRIGAPADDDDLDVVSSNTTRVAMDHSKKRIEVGLPLRDVGGENVGVLGLVWRLPVGGSRAEFERNATVIRDAVSRRILNVANLMEPYPYEPLVTTKSRAQTLVDEALLRHPDVTVLALRGRSGGELVLLGSTFGRHGKKADADDAKVMASKLPNTGIYSGGKRFGVDMALHDRSGALIGTMNVGYAYSGKEDPKALTARAVALRDDLQARIDPTQALNEIDP